MKAWLLAGCVLGAMLCACNQQQPPAQPGSFDRATRVAFACFDLTDPDAPVVASLHSCDIESPEAVSGDTITHALHALVVQSSRGEVAAVDILHQQTLDSRRDIPGYTFLPVGELPIAIVVPTTRAHAKYTYVANAGSRDITVLKTQAFRELGAQESPTVQTLPLPGGNRDAPYDMVLAPEEDALFISMPETGRVLRVPILRCDGTAPPPAAVDAGEGMLSEAGAAGAMSEPEPCTNDGELDPNGITEIPIDQSVARSAMDASPDVAAEKYLKACAYSAPVSNASLPLPELPSDAPQTQPKPSGMAIDSFCERDQPCSQRLLIADSALPIIHVVDLDAARSGSADAVQVPIRTGVPTTSVVVTPRVPVDTSAEPAETQYVYAIDATDGSVLVTEHGRLLQVGADGARPDRVSLGGGSTLPIALSISVMTPAFDVHGRANQHVTQLPAGSTLPDPTAGNFCTDTAHTIRSNLRLRGVFVAVGVADGSVRVIDIHDMDLAECRSCDKYRPGCDDCGGDLGNRCDACAVENWDPYPVVRHHTRIAPTADPTVDAPPLAPTARPTFVVGTDVIIVRITGTTSDPLVKGLDCVPCGKGQVLAYPDEDAVAAQNESGVDQDVDAGTATGAEPCANGSARVCAQNDPWAELDDWVAVYQGAIPGSRGGEGRLMLDGDNVQLQAEGRFCELGILGGDQLPRKIGDQLDIVGPLALQSAIENTEPHASDPNSSAGRTFESDTLAACKRLVSARDDTDEPSPIGFAIQEAYADHLVLAPNFATPRKDLVPAGFENDAQFVNKCFGGMPLTYQVRSGNGYVVLGRNTAGFSHHVVAQEGSGHCVQDSTKDVRLTGRAYENEPFDNGSVTFQIRGAGNPPPKIDTTLVIGLLSSTPKTVVNASVAVNTQVVASLPVDLRWNQESSTLYMVDIASRGLVPIVVDPWPISGVSRSYQ